MAIFLYLLFCTVFTGRAVHDDRNAGAIKIAARNKSNQSDEGLPFIPGFSAGIPGTIAPCPPAAQDERKDAYFDFVNKDETLHYAGKLVKYAETREHGHVKRRVDLELWRGFKWQVQLRSNPAGYHDEHKPYKFIVEDGRQLFLTWELEEVPGEPKGKEVIPLSDEVNELMRIPIQKTETSEEEEKPDFEPPFVKFKTGVNNIDHVVYAGEYFNELKLQLAMSKMWDDWRANRSEQAKFVTAGTVDTKGLNEEIAWNQAVQMFWEYQTSVKWKFAKAGAALGAGLLLAATISSVWSGTGLVTAGLVSASAGWKTFAGVTGVGAVGGGGIGAAVGAVVGAALGLAVGIYVGVRVYISGKAEDAAQLSGSEMLFREIYCLHPSDRWTACDVSIEGTEQTVYLLDEGDSRFTLGC